jgi:hypothetical protein
MRKEMEFEGREREGRGRRYREKRCTWGGNQGKGPSSFIVTV